MAKYVFSIVAALVPISAWAAEPAAETYRWGPHMMWGWGWGWSGMLFGPLLMILLLVAVIAAVAFFLRSLGGPRSGTAPHYPAPGRTALDILNERFARGEIDRAEYEEKRRLISHPIS